MFFEAKLYDRAGNEVDVKPGHSLVIGKNCMAQIPDNPESNLKVGQLVYRVPDEQAIAKYQAKWTFPLQKAPRPLDE